MTISNGAEANVKVWVPLLAFIGASWYTYKKREDLKEALLFGAVVGFIAWLVATQALKAAKGLANRNENVYITPDATGNGTAGGNAQSWSPNAITKELRDDVYRPWYDSYSRNTSLYERMAAMSNSQLQAMYNAWNGLFFTEHNESMVQAMDAENYSLTGLQTGALAKGITSRLKGMAMY